MKRKGNRNSHWNSLQQIGRDIIDLVLSTKIVPRTLSLQRKQWTRICSNTIIPLPSINFRLLFIVVIGIVLYMLVIYTSYDQQFQLYMNDVIETGMSQLGLMDVITPIAYVKWNVSVPCYEPESDWTLNTVQETPTNTGIIYIKTHKTGSSTCSGINIRIAMNLAKRQQQQTLQHQLNLSHNITDNQYNICQLRFDHVKASAIIPNRVKIYPTTSNNNNSQEEKFRRRSVLWTNVRDPTSRCISSFFHFEVSRRNRVPNNVNFKRYATGIRGDYYKHFLYTRTNVTGSNQTIINNILNEYDFIGITERMEESAVVLMMLLNLKLADILYLRAKTNGGYDDGGGFGDNNKTCTFIQPSILSTGMKKFFQSIEWKNQIQFDQKLYNAVNKSLDLTIESLGKEEFQKNLIKFRYALQMVESNCRNITIFPCDNTGTYHNTTDCKWTDSACGMKCIDDVSTKLGLW
jgi:Galactose-3-O-sulfotransferase